MKYRKVLALLLVAVLLVCAMPTVARAVGKNGWSRQNGKWYYYRNGRKATGWIQDGSGYYRLEGTRWVKVPYWFYLDRTGAMVEGWKKINGTWYYFIPKYGNMAVNNHYINGKLYFFNETSGAMQTGWVHAVDEEGYYWVYCDPVNGDASVGWRKIGGEWYYFCAHYTDIAQSTVPKMAHDETLTINGVEYTFGSSGAWVK